MAEEPQRRMDFDGQIQPNTSGTMVQKTLGVCGKRSLAMRLKRRRETIVECEKFRAPKTETLKASIV
jgi:hypothetical protein